MNNTKFTCPHCRKRYDDAFGTYLARCNKNKSFTTKITCLCGEKFKMTHNMMGDAVSFKIEKPRKNLLLKPK